MRLVLASFTPAASVRGQRVATRGVVTCGTLTCGVASGVGTTVGWRPFVARGGGVFCVVVAAGVGLWPFVVVGHVGQRSGLVVVEGAFATVGVGWRSAAAAGAHGRRVAASATAADVFIMLLMLLLQLQLPELARAHVLLLVSVGTYLRLVVGRLVVLIQVLVLVGDQLFGLVGRALQHVVVV
jgi:hypothetical protein